MLHEAVIAGAAESPYARRPPAGTTTERLLADAFQRALANAGIERGEVDGLGVASFTLAPDHAIDLAWRLGLRLRWLMEDTNGGASGLNLLQHAVAAVERGDAATIVLLAGDHFGDGDFDRLVNEYNRATRDHLAPIPFGGPNAQFALLTQRHMATSGLTRADYGRIPVAQRRWASLNPGAVYREPLTIQDYLSAVLVADPLGRYDCVPVVSGADAVVVASAARSRAVHVRAFRAVYNHDNQLEDGLELGLAELAPGLWDDAGFGPDALDLASVYDDYPVMVLLQLSELGLVPGGDASRFLALLDEERWPLNTSGGQLSAGQAGAAGGLHGLVESVLQLRGEAGDRQVDGASRALVCGYGMVLYRYGACANAAVLEAGA
jgi:acetyl-CoA acetyltransferase